MTQPEALPTIEKLDELFQYDPDGGTLYWKNSRGRVKVGDVAGHLRKARLKHYGVTG
jgi:hypothetical protein